MALCLDSLSPGIPGKPDRDTGSTVATDANGCSTTDEWAATPLGGAPSIRSALHLLLQLRTSTGSTVGSLQLPGGQLGLLQLS